MQCVYYWLLVREECRRVSPVRAVICTGTRILREKFLPNLEGNQIEIGLPGAPDLTAASKVLENQWSAGAEITELHARAELVIFLDPLGVERRGYSEPYPPVRWVWRWGKK